MMSGRKLDKTILSDDGTVKFDFMTSLQNIAIAKIVTSMWMNKNSLQDIVNFINSGIRPVRRESSDSWQQIKHIISTKVAELPLPKSAIEKLQNIIPVIGNSVLKWIRYHECIINTNEHSAVDQISNIKWTARGKIDYAQTAKNILAEKDVCLCDDNKYKLACTYCLEDEIAILAPNVVNQDYLDGVQIHMHPMVYFWTAHITGDSTKLCEHYRDYIKGRNVSINGYIIQLLINSTKRCFRTFNEVPIKYMWDKLSVEEKAKNIASLVKELSNQDLRYALLSSLDIEKQQAVFKKCSDTILIGILNDWLWEEYFLPTALHVFNIMIPADYIFILDHVNEKIIKFSQEKNKHMRNKYIYIFKQLWQESPWHLKDFAFDSENRYLLEDFVFSLPWEQNMDGIELILNDLNAKQKQNIIFQYRSIKRCADFIKNDQWDLLDQIIKYALCSEEDINELKEMMIKYRGYEIAEHFLEHEALDKIENFMTWAFKSEEDMSEFRKNLAYVKLKAALESITSNNKIDFKYLENHLTWCAKGDLEVINQFKAEFLESHSVEWWRILIKDDKYELLDQFLNWCLLHNKIKIARFKSNMYKNNQNFRSICNFLIRTDTSFKMLNKFVDWSFYTQDEVQEFKMWLLYPPEPIWGLCESLLMQNKFEQANKFVEWCATSAEKISEYKKMLMLSEDLISIVKVDISDKQILQLLIKWFNPSEELVKEFKKVFPEEEWPNMFYELLDDFLQSRNNVLESN